MPRKVTPSPLAGAARALQPTEQQLITEGRNALINYARAGTLACQNAARFVVAGFLEKLGAKGTVFFFGSVVFAAIHSLASEGAFEEAHALLDELGTLEGIDGSRIAAQPSVCLQISELRKGLQTYEGGPESVRDDSVVMHSIRAVFAV